MPNKKPKAKKYDIIKAVSKIKYKKKGGNK